MITIEDNGPGIQADKKEKIFHPFFTTKPTGEGTGLGLSLSYDIIKKAHGGELYCHSEEGQGAQFSIKLPINNLAICPTQRRIVYILNIHSSFMPN